CTRVRFGDLHLDNWFDIW
nr:immunoglobulin heavy chain junction region [Macaca mulatta]